MDVQNYAAITSRRIIDKHLPPAALNGPPSRKSHTGLHRSSSAGVICAAPVLRPGLREQVPFPVLRVDIALLPLIGWSSRKRGPRSPCGKQICLAKRTYSCCNLTHLCPCAFKLFKWSWAEMIRREDLALAAKLGLLMLQAPQDHNCGNYHTDLQNSVLLGAGGWRSWCFHQAGPERIANLENIDGVIGYSYTCIDNGEVVVIYWVGCRGEYRINHLMG